jgi:hypothetical protein
VFLNLTVSLCFHLKYEPFLRLRSRSFFRWNPRLLSWAHQPKHVTAPSEASVGRCRFWCCKGVTTFQGDFAPSCKGQSQCRRWHSIAAECARWNNEILAAVRNSEAGAVTQNCKPNYQNGYWCKDLAAVSKRVFTDVIRENNLGGIVLQVPSFVMRHFREVIFRRTSLSGRLRVHNRFLSLHYGLPTHHLSNEAILRNWAPSTIQHLNIDCTYSTSRNPRVVLLCSLQFIIGVLPEPRASSQNIPPCFLRSCSILSFHLHLDLPCGLLPTDMSTKHLSYFQCVLDVHPIFLHFIDGNDIWWSRLRLSHEDPLDAIIFGPC